jgi:ectoine hydroxylase
VLCRELPALFAQERPEVWRERDGKAVRTVFAAHTFNEAFGRLGAHPRLIEPVMELLDGPVYIHQFKINAKAAFDGDVWQWHQDYGTWARDDLMPAPRAMNVALFLEEVSEFNGPLMFIPKSHKAGVFEAGHDLATTSYPLWTLDRATVTHASPSNISPWDRTIVYVSACHVDNHIRQFKRPEWIAHRDFTPIQVQADDCLMALAKEDASSGQAAE